MTQRKISRFILGLLSMGLCGAFSIPAEPGCGDFTLNVVGRVMDMRDKPLDSVQVLVDLEGDYIDRLTADGKGRFALKLDIGGLYGIEVNREGYILKRFMVDSRTDDPAKVIAGAFMAEINLRPSVDLANVDISELELPYAMVVYSPKDKAFVADESYILEMKMVEAALMLSAARAKKRAAQ